MRWSACAYVIQRGRAKVSECATQYIRQSQKGEK